MSSKNQTQYTGVQYNHLVVNTICKQQLRQQNLVIFFPYNSQTWYTGLKYKFLNKSL